MSKKDEFMKKWAVGGMPADKIRLANAAWDEATAAALSHIANEQQGFEQYASRNGTNPDAIEKHGTNFAYTRTNAARVVWLACLEWVRGGV